MDVFLPRKGLKAAMLCKFMVGHSKGQEFVRVRGALTLGSRSPMAAEFTLLSCLAPASSRGSLAPATPKSASLLPVAVLTSYGTLGLTREPARGCMDTRVCSPPRTGSAAPVVAFVRMRLLGAPMLLLRTLWRLSIVLSTCFARASASAAFTAGIISTGVL